MTAMAPLPEGSSRYLSVRSDMDYVERIFDEKDRAAEFQRQTLERALIEARTTAERAMQEAKSTTDTAREADRKSVEQRLVEAKVAADNVTKAIGERLKSLESGGAPFASRLDSSLTTLKGDVDVLKENMVKTTVLDALREKDAEETKAQKRRVLIVGITAGASLALTIIEQLVGK